MRVLRAESMGMCFGVKDALAVAGGVAAPGDVTIHGQLVHNPQVNRDLELRGFRLGATAGVGPVPETPRVLITAHGVSDRERRRLREAGKELLDTTCPLVTRVHDAAQRLAREGFFVIVVGRPDHVEVRGIMGDLDRAEVVAGPEAVRAYDAVRLGVVCQSTTPPQLARAVLDAILCRNPGREIRYLDTICRPTRERQDALADLLGRVEALVVVGGRHSNNTRELVANALARGVPALHVETAADLDAAWLSRFSVVGLTAGTSTPDAVIDAVHRGILALAAPGMEVAS